MLHEFIVKLPHHLKCVHILLGKKFKEFHDRNIVTKNDALMMSPA